MESLWEPVPGSNSLCFSFCPILHVASSASSLPPTPAPPTLLTPASELLYGPQTQELCPQHKPRERPGLSFSSSPFRGSALEARPSKFTHRSAPCAACTPRGAPLHPPPILESSASAPRVGGRGRGWERKGQGLCCVWRCHVEPLCVSKTPESQRSTPSTWVATATPRCISTPSLASPSWRMPTHSSEMQPPHLHTLHVPSEGTFRCQDPKHVG